MFRPGLAGIALTALALIAPCATADTAPADSAAFGTVDFVEGVVSVKTAGGVQSSPKSGDTIVPGSTLTTGPNGEIHVTTVDQGFVALRPNTVMRVDSYRAEGGDDDNMALSLVKGSFRAITGWIGQFNRESDKVVTPTATIGIRGTDHEPSYVAPEDAAALGEEAGTYDKVNDGGSFIDNGHGRTEVDPNQSGFASFKHTEAPRRLDHVPKFYHPSRNEQRIESRKQFVRQNMLARHTERQNVWARQHPERAQRLLEHNRQIEQQMRRPNQQGMTQQRSPYANRAPTPATTKRSPYGNATGYAGQGVRQPAPNAQRTPAAANHQAPATVRRSPAPAYTKPVPKKPKPQQ